MLTQNLNVRADNKGIVPIVHMVQGDSGRRITCILQDYDIPSGSSASLSVERPDGNVYIASATISNNNVSATITSTMLNVVGIAKATMHIISSGSIVSTFEFVIKVEEAAGFAIEPSPADNSVYVYINGNQVKVLTSADLDDYYTKDETYSAEEIDDKIAEATPEDYDEVKAEVSSLSESIVKISEEFDGTVGKYKDRIAEIKEYEGNNPSARYPYIRVLNGECVVGDTWTLNVNIMSPTPNYYSFYGYNGSGVVSDALSLDPSGVYHGGLLNITILKSIDYISITPVYDEAQSISYSLSLTKNEGGDGKTVEDALDEHESKIGTIERTVEELSRKGSTSVNGSPIIINMMDYFWSGGYEKLSSRVTSDDTGASLYLLVSGSKNGTSVTVNASSPLSLNDLYDICGGIIEYSEGNCELVSLHKNGSTLEIYPPLKQNVSSAKIYSEAVSIHLTEKGYYYYTDSFYRANKKYTEKNKPIAQYNAFAYDSETNPLVKIGSYWWGKGSRNVRESSRRVVVNGTRDFLNCNFVTGATAASPKGFEWEVNLNGKSGYLEMYLGAEDATKTNAELASGLELTMELSLDGVVKETKVKKFKGFEPIRFDFQGASKGKIKVTTTGGSADYQVCLSQITWWEAYNDEEKVFEPYALPVMLMDSWGVYHNNATQRRLVDLMSADADGMDIPVVNNSLGGMTSNWGVDNFFEKAKSVNPEYMITDFQINDINTGVSIDTYNHNMTKLIKASLANGIVPVLLMSGHVTTNGIYRDYTLPFIKYFSNL